MSEDSPFTSMKEIELLLKQSRESLDFALESARMGTWDIDLEAKTISCSPEMLKLWGVNPEEFTGHRSTLQSKVHPDDLDKMNLAIDSAIQNGSIYELEYRILPHPGVERWVMSRGRCTISPESNRATRFSGVVFDITENKRKEEELALALKARDQFFMMASHELRTPLTCLRLQLQVMEWDLKHKYPVEFNLEKMKSGLQKQREHLHRITRIVDNILDESRISEGRLLIQRENFDLCQMITEVIEQFQVISESSQVQIVFNKFQKITGEWDRFHLEQVILNLLSNAMRYGNRRPIYVELLKEENNALIRIRDEGIGIDEKDQARVFERFERATTENEVNGMGLGLFISSSIVEAHGGRIQLKSELGKGSEFTVIIPT